LGMRIQRSITALVSMMWVFFFSNFANIDACYSSWKLF
jgi:hypothetical protein